MGTPLYLSPQAISHNIYSTKADIWSLGVMFYEMLHGCTPWSGCKTEKELLDKVRGQKLDFKVRVAPELEKLITGCLEVDEHRRLDPHQLAELLTQLL